MEAKMIDQANRVNKNILSTVLPNPDFDDGLTIWDDVYTGQYQPVVYSEQFDGQWRLFLERKRGYCNHTGVETSDQYIDDRIYELTGVRDVMLRRRFGAFAGMASKLSKMAGKHSKRAVGGKLYLEPKFPLDYFQGKKCLDIGCGAGRWTRTLLMLDAQVKSVDVGENALRSTRRFNADTEYLDIFDIQSRADLHAAFDFVLCWGVIMCTHDPKIAFQQVASTVKPGGSLYVMVYAPTYHVSEFVRATRLKFHRECKTAEEKQNFVMNIAEDPDNAINYMDMLNTFYNWTIPQEVVTNWFKEAGFKSVVVLNEHEPHNCAWHVLGTKA
ncbi:MAG: hypothetical protein CTY29_06340 [Methylobacter sp.]|nr:MAG: hypothetical protein CTY29_06340 [Methylobacter sp.]